MSTLAAMGTKLADQNEVLFRQIHPQSIDKGVPDSDRFKPSKLDKNQLSTDRSSLTTAEAAHTLYTSNGRQSGAVFGLTVGEFVAESITCHEDPIKDDVELPDNPAHAYADYSAHNTAQQKLIAKRLKRLAIARGCLFTPALA